MKTDMWGKSIDVICSRCGAAPNTREYCDGSDFHAEFIPRLSPWSIDVEDDGVIIVRTGDATEDATLNNAALIAAAPDLLAALEALAATARTFRNVPQEEQQWTTIDDDALNAAFAAIAKARSERIDA